MKKVLSILVVMMVVMASVFATSGDKLWITSTVTAVPPTYVMRGSLSAYPADSSAGTLASATESESTLEGGNIATAAGGIDVYVKLFQSNSSTYLDADGVTVAIWAGDLKKDGTSTDYRVSPTVVESAKIQASANTDFDATTAPADLTGDLAGKVGKQWLFQYKTGAQVTAQALGTIKFNYAQDATLPPGDYEAEITLVYTTN